MEEILFFPTKGQIDILLVEEKVKPADWKVRGKPWTNFCHKEYPVLGDVTVPCVVDGPSARYTLQTGDLILADDRQGFAPDGIAVEKAEYFNRV